MFVISYYCVCNFCVVYCFGCVYVLFCVCLCIVVPLQPDTYPLSVNNNNNNIIIIIIIINTSHQVSYCYKINTQKRIY
jgi:hypothetical protein